MINYLADALFYNFFKYTQEDSIIMILNGIELCVKYMSNNNLLKDKRRYYLLLNEIDQIKPIALFSKNVFNRYLEIDFSEQVKEDNLLFGKEAKIDLLDEQRQSYYTSILMKMDFTLWNTHFQGEIGRFMDFKAMERESVNDVEDAGLDEDDSFFIDPSIKSANQLSTIIDKLIFKNRQDFQIKFIQHRKYWIISNIKKPTLQAKIFESIYANRLKVIYRSGLNITFIDKVNQAFVNYYNYAEEIKKVFRDRKCMRKYKIDEQDFIERKELEALILEELKVKQEIAEKKRAEFIMKNRGKTSGILKMGGKSGKNKKNKKKTGQNPKKDIREDDPSYNLDKSYLTGDYQSPEEIEDIYTDELIFESRRRRDILDTGFFCITCIIVMRICVTQSSKDVNTGFICLIKSGVQSL